MVKPHYHLTMAVTKEDVDVLRAELDEYINKTGGFILKVDPIEGDLQPSEELSETIKTLFGRLIACILESDFKRIN